MIEGSLSTFPVRKHSGSQFIGSRPSRAYKPKYIGCVRVCVSEAQECMCAGACECECVKHSTSMMMLSCMVFSEVASIYFVLKTNKDQYNKTI